MESKTNVFQTSRSNGDILDMLSRKSQPQFYGRKSELQYLENLYSMPSFSGAVIYGRRQIGKSALLKEFCHKHTSVYLESTKSKDDTEELYRQLQEIIEPLADKQLKNALTDTLSFRDLIKVAFALSFEVPLVVVLDEYSYLLSQDRDFSSYLQALIDKVRGNPNCKLTLILCGSCISIMSCLLNADSPLYGRLLMFPIKPLQFEDCRKMLPNMCDKDALETYMCFGGLPGMITPLVGCKSLSEVLHLAFLDKGNLYRNYGSFSWATEGISYYAANQILQAVINGYSSLNEIKSVCGWNEELECTLQQLKDTKIIHKKHVLFSHLSRHTERYEICDNYTLFYETFIGKLEWSQDYPVDLSEQVFEELPEFFGHRFESICTDFLIKKDAITPVDMGYWMDRISDPSEKTSVIEELDIVIKAEDRVHLAECKYREKMTDLKVLQKFYERTCYISTVLKKQLCIFSKSEFTQDAIQFAAERSIALYTLRDMLGYYATI